VGDREIRETCLNSASKNTSETDIFPHGPKSLLTSVIKGGLLSSARRSGGDQLCLLLVRIFTTQVNCMYCMHTPTRNYESSIKKHSCKT